MLPDLLKSGDVTKRRSEKKSEVSFRFRIRKLHLLIGSYLSLDVEIQFYKKKNKIEKSREIQMIFRR